MALFGNVADGSVQLNEAGRMVQMAWDHLPHRFPFASVEAFVVMPNHVHGIVVLAGADHKDRPYGKGDRPKGTLPGSLGRVVQAFKSVTTCEYIAGTKLKNWPYPGKLWQRSYYDHIVRNEDDLNRIRQYIATNPARWLTRNP